MAATPEAKVKKAVRKGLDHLIKAGRKIYYHMPVMNGMGRPTLDFIGCIDGRYFAIETKAPGKTPTPIQQGTIDEISAAGGVVLVIATDDSEEVSACLAMLLR